MCLNLINPMTPHKDCPGQGLTKLKHKAFSPIFWMVNFILIHAPTSQVLDYAQKPFDPKLKI